jgi:hypothetical protein
VIFFEWNSRSLIKKLSGDQLSVIFSFLPVSSILIVVLLRQDF